ncbi:MAG: Flp pilus assembly complex ATPase component TadA, partial [Gemmataceae bacterium]|nr:Flp pilus assembly complex ATPase component TadA [Gemmataceae bacterium]
RYRVDGTLHTTLVLPVNTFDGIIARIKILSKLRLDEKRKPQDGSFFTMINNRKIEFRVSTFPAYFGEKVVMRILDSEHGVRAVVTQALLELREIGLARGTSEERLQLIGVRGPVADDPVDQVVQAPDEIARVGFHAVPQADGRHLGGVIRPPLEETDGLVQFLELGRPGRVAQGGRVR